MSERHKVIKGISGLMSLEHPKIMGIINITPDSFYSGSRKMQIGQVVRQVDKMVSEGVDIIDLGGMSSRPGAEEPSVSEELDRIIGPLMAVRAAYPDLWISIDTYRTEVLQACIDLRIDMVNDISAGQKDEQFLKLVASTGLPYVLMHMQGNPLIMQDHPSYDDVVLDILKFLDQRYSYCRSLGIEQVIIDPGFGFGKQQSDNYRLLKNLSSFKILDSPILVGLSRKSMIYKPLNIAVDEALNGTSALHMIALNKGAKILRVHDVKEAKECIDLWQLLQDV